MSQYKLTSEILQCPIKKSAFIENNIRLVHHIVSTKINVNGDCYDDFVQVGAIGLVKAVNSFNIEKNIAFATYATTCIFNEILMYIRKNKKHLHNVSLNSTIQVGKDSDSVTLEDTIQSNVDIQGEFELKSEINDLAEQYMLKLKDRDKEVVELLISGKTQKEIGSLLNLSQSYISRTVSKLKKKFYKLSTDYNGFESIKGKFKIKKGKRDMSSKFVSDAAKIVAEWAIENAGNCVDIKEVLSNSGIESEMSFSKKKNIKEAVRRIVEARGYQFVEKGHSWYIDAKASGVRTYNLKDDPELAKKYLDKQKPIEKEIKEETSAVATLVNNNVLVNFEGYKLDITKTEYIGNLMNNLLLMYPEDEIVMCLMVERRCKDAITV